MIAAVDAEAKLEAARVEPVADELIAKIVERIGKLKIGNGAGVDGVEPDMGPLITGVHRDKVSSYVDIAEQDGATIVVDGRGFTVDGHEDGFFFGPTLIDEIPTTSRAYQEEIFGPVLPVKTYVHIDEAIEYVNEHDRPLGLYYFGQNADEREKVLTKTISGGVTVNDVIFHVSMEDLPFGGVGPSGMGSYHGVEGFREFSHARSIYTQPKIDVAKLGGFKPPYGAATEKAVKTMMK